MHNIDKDSPPTVVFRGTKDALIPMATAEEYKKRMTDLGRRCVLHFYEGQPHGFFNYKSRENYNATVIEADKWLPMAQRGAVEKDSIPIPIATPTPTLNLPYDATAIGGRFSFGGETGTEEVLAGPFASTCATPSC